MKTNNPLQTIEEEVSNLFFNEPKSTNNLDIINNTSKYSVKEMKQYLIKLIQELKEKKYSMVV